MGVGIVCIQEPFIGKRDIQHNGFNLYWPGGERRNARVFTIIRKDLTNRIVIEKRSDLIDYSYLIVLDIRDLDQKIRIPIRRIRVINIYDQVIDRGYTYLRTYIKRRRAIEDIS